MLVVIPALIVLAGLALRLLPRLLDRAVHVGPPSDHFDGERFFNPDYRRADGTPPVPRRFSYGRMLRFMVGMDRAPWPSRAAVAEATPAARIDGDALRVTWIGHATVLIQTQGLNILTDPVWSNRASPLPLVGPKRVRAPAVAFEALPPIDVVLLSHGHYDHLDLPTLRRLWRRDRPRILHPLGHDALLRRNGIASQAHDWNDRVEIAPDVAVVLDRVRHWTSRAGVDRNRALWCGFTIELPGGNLFFAGDTALGDGGWIAPVAARGPIRCALIPIGAYRPREMMAGSHCDPSEAAAIFTGLGAAYALAIHWGTFRLSAEAIDDPPRDLGSALGALAADRFRASPPGGVWDVPAL
jgi:L-ascorbate metabolism protein UlaG (beta-lactamase superfamily)